MQKKLSVIIPVFNEEKTISKVIEKVKKGWENLEIIVVDDCSKDKTWEEIEKIKGVKKVRHEKNQGKGAAIRTGQKEVTGKYVIIQDADMEYDPKDYKTLIKPMEEGFADVVYGSRFMGGKPHRILFFSHTIGNKILTFISNLFTNLNLTDMETGYKAFASDVFKKIKIEENRFGFEPEVTAKIAKMKNVRVYEVGVSYYGRTYEEGKKIRLKDGLWALWCVVKYNLFS